MWQWCGNCSMWHLQVGSTRQGQKLLAITMFLFASMVELLLVVYTCWSVPNLLNAGFSLSTRKCNPIKHAHAAAGRTPLIRAPIGFYAKVRLFKARFEGEAAIYRYKKYINWLQIDEILTYVFMYGGSFHLVFAVRTPKKRRDYFWPVFWPENAFSPFSYTGDYLFVKMKNWIVLTFSVL